MSLPREFWRDIARVHESHGNFTSAARIREWEPLRTAWWACSNCGGVHQHRWAAGYPKAPPCQGRLGWRLR